ncbi:MAG: NADH-quinone oxidoreductase subunit K, partial [Acidimicrobiales bacterium]
LVVCVSIAQSSTYVLLLEVGYVAGGSAPIFFDVGNGTKVVDPVVQALVLTDLVIGLGVAALLLALAVQVHKHTGTLDPAKVRPMSG